MAQEGSKTLRQHSVAAGRDIIVMSTVLTIVGGVLSFLLRPYWEPYKELPRSVVTLQQSVEAVQATLAQSASPLAVETLGNGQIVSEGPYQAGGTITLLYALRRNVSCDGQYSIRFYNVSTGTEFFAGIVEAQKAPTTSTFNPFKIDVRLPADIPEGRYIYWPRHIPRNCGVYGPQAIAPSEIFEVNTENSQ